MQREEIEYMSHQYRSLSEIRDVCYRGGKDDMAAKLQYKTEVYGAIMKDLGYEWKNDTFVKIEAPKMDIKPAKDFDQIRIKSMTEPHEGGK